MTRSTLIPLCLCAALASPAAAQTPASKKVTKSVGPNVPAAIPTAVYRARRARLMKALGTCAGVIKSFPNSGNSGDVAPDPYFFYLTGLDERGAVLVLAPREPIYKQIMVLSPRDPEREIWTGYRAPLSPKLRAQLGVDVVRRGRGGVPWGLGKALRRSRCYARLRSPLANKPAVPSKQLGKYLSAYRARTEQKWEALETMRAIKGPEEIKRMEKAIAITFEGHRAAVRHLKPGVSERQIASKIEDAFFAHGATGLAFPSIVGSAENAAILHWTKRNRIIKNSDLVLVDIGASYGGYAADITRTWPASGTFTAEQRKVYETVLRVQKKVIAAVKPGVSLDRLHKLAETELAKAGHRLPHYVGHFVGLKVHDVGNSGAPLQPGMVITVEPGIYIKGKLGVRIEDMVLVTTKGARVMSAGLPRTVAEVEAYVRKR